MAQKLGQLRRFIAALPQECVGQLAAFGADLRNFWLQCQALAFIGPGVCLSLLSTVGGPGRERPVLAVALCTLAIACAAFSSAGFWANLVDHGPRQAGMLLGISNTVASLPGVLVNLLSRWMLERSGGSYAGPLRLTVLIYALALLPFLCCCSTKPVFR